MAVDPLVRFLEVSPSADARMILGLGPAALDPGRIETALRERLARVYNHSDGNDEDAEMDRRKLREAARARVTVHHAGGSTTPFHFLPDSCMYIRSSFSMPCYASMG